MPGQRTVAAACVVALAPALLAAPLQPASSRDIAEDTIAIGFACGDGTFVPLAARTRDEWRPLIKHEDSLWFAALTPEALRLPRQGWILHPHKAGTPRPLALRSPRTNGIDDTSECATVQAFDSDVARARGRVIAPDGTRAPASLIGLGVLGAATFEYVDDVTTQPDEGSRQVAQRIVNEVHAAERRLVREAGERSPLLRFSGNENVRSVVRLVSLVRHRDSDGEWYHFQARKRYGEWYVFEGKRQQRVWADVFVTGWVRTSPDGLSTVNVWGGFEDADGKTTTFYRVSGILHVGDRDVWVTEHFQYEQQSYELFEIGPVDTKPKSVLTVVIHGS